MAVSTTTHARKFEGFIVGQMVFTSGDQTGTFVHGLGGTPQFVLASGRIAIQPAVTADATAVTISHTQGTANTVDFIIGL